MEDAWASQNIACTRTLKVFKTDSLHLRRYPQVHDEIKLGTKRKTLERMIGSTHFVISAELKCMKLLETISS